MPATSFFRATSSAVRRLTEKDIPASKTGLLRLLMEINRPEIDFDRLEELIKSDVALSVRLLRFLHSAGFGWRHEVNTIGQALRVLGERPARKWASLVALTLIGEDKPPELLQTTLVRAQLCEQLGAEAALPEREADLFLVGLLSTLDAMLDRPMDEVLAQLSVSPRCVRRSSRETTSSAIPSNWLSPTTGATGIGYAPSPLGSLTRNPPFRPRTAMRLNGLPG